jgi:hypothetical protein
MSSIFYIVGSGIMSAGATLRDVSFLKGERDSSTERRMKDTYIEELKRSMFNSLCTDNQDQCTWSNVDLAYGDIADI